MNLPSNPFSTRFVRPGSIPFHFPGQIKRQRRLERIAGEILQSPASLIVGPHGSGKSTLLHDLQPQLQRGPSKIISILLHSPARPGLLANYLHRRQNFARVWNWQRDLPEDGLLIIDGIEQLSGASRRRIVKQAAADQHRILATSHWPILGFKTIHETTVTPQIIKMIASAVAKNESENLKKVIDDELHRRELSTVTNVRDLLFDLYDLAANVNEDRQCQTLSASLPATRSG